METPLTESLQAGSGACMFHKIPRGHVTSATLLEPRGWRQRGSKHNNFLHSFFLLSLGIFRSPLVLAQWHGSGGGSGHRSGLFISLTSIPYLPRTQIVHWRTILLDLCLGGETPSTGPSPRVLEGEPRNLLSRWGEPLLRALRRALVTHIGSLWIVSYGGAVRWGNGKYLVGMDDS